MYSENGVFIDQNNLVHGKKAKLTYKGYLYQQGAEDVYVHLGFGLLWEGLREIKMTRTDDGFETQIPLEIADTLNFCFRDNWNNWDNNSYQNYSYDVARSETTNTTSASDTTADTVYSDSKTGMPAETVSPEIPAGTIQDTPACSLKEAAPSTAIETAASAVEPGKSLIPTFGNEFSHFSRLPQNYLKNKKMRIMLYRMFAYIPRLLNGYTRKRARSIFKKYNLFQ